MLQGFLQKRFCRWGLMCAVLACAAVGAVIPQNPAALTEDQMREFLLHASVVRGIQDGKGVTRPYRLTLSDGVRTHDGSFQSIDEYNPYKKFDDGKSEMNFRDSYKYNIAAYELAVLLGIGKMMPVTVERKWDGKIGSLSWWLPAKMDEEKRRKLKLLPADRSVWDLQMFKMSVFSELVHDVDRHPGNILYSADWHLWMIDFSRAFRLYTTLRNPENLVRCDRTLLKNLRALDRAALEARTGRYLTKPEITAVMARRDKIVALFEARIAQQGEKAVLFDYPPAGND